MSRKKLAAAALAAVVILTASAPAFFFFNVCLVTGTMMYQGKPADIGTPVTAYIATEKVAEGLIKLNGTFELKIPEYDPTKPEIKGYRSAADVVQVKLDGKNAKPTFSPTQENLKIDLHVETTLDVKLSTWGKIKALFK